MLDLPAATLHIDGQFAALILICGLGEALLKGLVDIVVRTRSLQEPHPIVGSQCLDGLSPICHLDLIVEQTGISRAVRLIVQPVKQRFGRYEAIALPRGKACVGFRQMIVEPRQHLVDTYAERIEG